MSRLRLFVLMACVIFITACTFSTPRTQQPVAFQLYSGNEALPPEYQQITIIRGTIDPAKIDIVYTFRDKQGTIERPLTVQGGTYQTTMQLIQNTQIEAAPSEGRPIGGGNFDVTLIDADGTKLTGTPSNRSDWEQFAQEIAQAVGNPT